MRRRCFAALYQTDTHNRLQVAYQRILQLTYVEDLLKALKALFVQLYRPFLTTFVASLHAIHAGKAVVAGAAPSWDFAAAFANWDVAFDRLLATLEDKAAQVGWSSLDFALYIYSNGCGVLRSVDHAHVSQLVQPWTNPHLLQMIPAQVRSISRFNLLV
jgi:hypothetical protein